MWPPTPPAAYYHDPCCLLYAPRSITTATCPHSSHLIIYNNPTKMTWHLVMKMYIFPYPACVHGGTPLTRFDCHPEKIYQRFPLLHTRGLSSSLSYISSLHTLLTPHKHTFPFHKLSRSLSLKSEKTKNGENGVALCAVCASSFGYRQPTDEQPIQRARARVLWHLPCRFRNLRHHLHSWYLSGFLILCSSFVCVALVVVFNYV